MNRYVPLLAYPNHPPKDEYQLSRLPAWPGKLEPCIRHDLLCYVGFTRCVGVVGAALCLRSEATVR